ncbi:MAG: hypothetical protein FWH27_16070, partial [Planctomycetaceae bacterium]|nr:hypothetical protein [Planctomycetaceae bacterium]
MKNRLLISLTATVLAFVTTTAAFAIIAARSDDDPIQTFALKEYFGVDFVEQVVAFSLDEPADPEKCRLVDGNGNEVQFQTIEN